MWWVLPKVVAVIMTYTLVAAGCPEDRCPSPGTDAPLAALQPARQGSSGHRHVEHGASGNSDEIM